eukprot:1257544-Amorphochlora_amoeboformis.AAC.2
MLLPRRCFGFSVSDLDFGCPPSVFGIPSMTSKPSSALKTPSRQLKQLVADKAPNAGDNARGLFLVSNFPIIILTPYHPADCATLDDWESVSQLLFAGDFYPTLAAGQYKDPHWCKCETKGGMRIWMKGC